MTLNKKTQTFGLCKSKGVLFYFKRSKAFIYMICPVVLRVFFVHMIDAKNRHTSPVYSVLLNRAFDRI